MEILQMQFNIHNARVGELVDPSDLESGVARRVGSSPTMSTTGSAKIVIALVSDLFTSISIP